MSQDLNEIHRTTVPCLKEFHTKHFDDGYKNCNLLSKVIGGMAIFAQISFVILGSGLSYMVEKTDYPLPCFWQISVYPATDWFSYGFNMFVQAVLCGATIVSFVCNSTFIYYVASCVIAKLDVTIDIVEEQKQISDELSYDKWIALVTDSICESKR